MEERKCKEYQIRMVSQCGRSYKKAAKKMDRRLYGAIAACLDRLKTDPLFGKKMAGSLAGLHSARVANFAYRVVYEVDDADCIVTVHAILHRGTVYGDLARRA